MEGEYYSNSVSGKRRTMDELKEDNNVDADEKYQLWLNKLCRKELGFRRSGLSRQKKIHVADEGLI